MHLLKDNEKDSIQNTEALIQKSCLFLSNFFSLSFFLSLVLKTLPESPHHYPNCFFCFLFLAPISLYKN